MGTFDDVRREAIFDVREEDAGAAIAAAAGAA